MPFSSLLGPPELYNSTPSNSSDPFIDQMVTNVNKKSTQQSQPLKGLTENSSPTFLTTNNPCLDFFFHFVPNTPANIIDKRLSLAWAHDPLKTLKLVCNLRGVRRTGKSNKEGFYPAALWLHNYHPKALACNVASVADFRYYKDLLEILYRLVEGSDVRETQRKERLRRQFYYFKQKMMSKKKKNSKKKESFSMELSKAEKEKASAMREEKRISMARKLLEKIFHILSITLSCVPPAIF